MYGQLSEEHGQPVFHWSHSYGQLFPPEEPYRPEGQFMYFATYNVEKRDRVKCVSGPEGKSGRAALGAARDQYRGWQCG